MFVGIDFPSLFEQDNYELRHTTGHNMLDPESLISGEELAKGLNYKNSKRWWASKESYLRAVSGEVSTDDILRDAPRVLLPIG